MTPLEHSFKHHLASKGGSSLLTPDHEFLGDFKNDCKINGK